MNPDPGVQFQSQEELVEFFDRLSVEFSFKCFHDKIPTACQALGDYYEVVKKDYEKAGKVYQQNCDENQFGQSCYKFAKYRMVGRGGPGSEPLAKSYFIKSCQHDFLQGCHSVGVLLSIPEIKNSDVSHAVQYFNKACTKGFPKSCNVLFSIFSQGRGNVSKNMEKAYEFAVKGCELGAMQDCWNVGVMNKKGQGVEKNEQLAKEYFEKAKQLRKKSEIVSVSMSDST